MITLNFDTWNTCEGTWFLRTRIYINNRWTPFCKIQLSYHNRIKNKYLSGIKPLFKLN